VHRALALALVTFTAAVVAGPACGALRLVAVASGFERPVHVASTASEPSRLYVVEQAGVIRVVENGRVRAAPFLDIRDLVACCGEQGLLSLAFHPSYGRNGRLYIDYTNRAGDTRVVEYRANAARTRAVERTARRLLAVDQPYANHNGGQLAFGRDGFLYVGMGDGGSGGDPGNRAQSMRTRLGKLLRLDVRTRRARIVALGFRNPWRFSVDRRTGRFFIGDVGQGSREEIDVYRPHARGLENYGWRRYEGTLLYESGTRLYPRSRYVRPVHQYLTHGNGGCAITGGFVYRGSAVPSARGRYFFGDYCNGRVWSFVLRNGRRSDFRLHSGLTVPGNLSSFGEGARGELYLVSHNGGRIYRLGG
jgi:glucose/arabinose dehydrogenase